MHSPLPATRLLVPPCLSNAVASPTPRQQRARSSRLSPIPRRVTAPIFHLGRHPGAARSLPLSSAVLPMGYSIPLPRHGTSLCLSSTPRPLLVQRNRARAPRHGCLGSPLHWLATPHTVTAQGHLRQRRQRLHVQTIARRRRSLPSSSSKSTVPVPSNTKKKKKKLTTQQQNIATIILNEINQWAQSDATFDDELESNFTKQEFVTWKSEFKKQIT